MFGIFLLLICAGVVCYMLTRNMSSRKGLPEDNGHLKMEDRANIRRARKQQEVDRILDKIHHKGIDSLNKYEKGLLDEYSGSL